VSSKLVIVAQDHVNDDRFGTGPLDRAVRDRLVVTAHEAGAEAIGLDHRLDQQGPVQQGGATGDALLLEAVTSSEPVVTVFDEDTLPVGDLSESTPQGHLSLMPHSDHVVRTVPLVTEFGSHALPAFGHILFSPTRSLEWSTGDMHLLNIVGNGSVDALPTMALSSVWDAVQRHEESALAGWFREGLYFRLKGLVFQLPPLRERRGDIPVILKTSLDEIAQQMGRPAPQISNDAVRLLIEHHWPGNVRELRHAIERAIALSNGTILTPYSFALEGTARGNGLARTTFAVLPDSAGDAAVLHCLRQHGFEMQAAAKALGWDRSSVTQRLKGLCFQALIESGGDQAKAGDPAICAP
jgi:hypothetical protein